MAFGVTFLNENNYIQIDEFVPNQRVIERGNIPSGTVISFARAAGALFIRPNLTGASVYLSSDRNIIYCTSGTISYVVLGDARSYTPPSTGFGLKIKNPNTQDLIFSDEMEYPRVRYSAILPADIATTPVTISIPGTYPGQLTYASIYSLGLDKWQIGLSFITYWNIAMTIAPDENSVNLSVFTSQISAQVSPYFWGQYNTFTYELPNHLQLIQV